MDTPVPIPNTEVKHRSGENISLRQDSEPPGFFYYLDSCIIFFKGNIIMTKYCNVCGRSYEDNTPLGTGNCPYNHAAITKSSLTSKSSSSSNYRSSSSSYSSSSSSSSYSGSSDSLLLGLVIGFFLPFWGLIIALIVRKSKPFMAKGIVIMSIIYLILGVTVGVLMFVLGGGVFSFQPIIDWFQGK